MLRKIKIAVGVLALFGVASLPFANPNFLVWRNAGSYSTYHEWPSPNDTLGAGAKDGWRADGQSAIDVYEQAVRASISDLKRLFVSPAHAQTGQRRLLLSGGPPSWVLPGAASDMDFANGRYYGCSLTACLSITRESPETDLLPTSTSGYAYNTYGNNVLAISPGVGLLIFEARTNFLLNSTAPVTQTTGSLANGAYTLWVNGTGSAQMSAGTATGCGTGTATNGSPVTFTLSGAAGTCTVTVTGALNAFQLEKGSFGTPFIVTAGATATRAADNISAIGALATNLQVVNGAIVAKTLLLPSNFTSDFVGANGLNVFGRSGSTIFSSNGSTNFFGPTMTGANANKSGFSWAATPSRFLVINNGTVSTTTDTKQTFAGTYFIGSANGSSGHIDGYLARLSLIPALLTSAQLKALTQ